MSGARIRLRWITLGVKDSVKVGDRWTQKKVEYTKSKRKSKQLREGEDE